MLRYWLAFMPGLTIAAVALCAAVAVRLRFAGLRRCRCAGPACGDQRRAFVATEPTFYPTSGDLPYRTVQALPDDATVWTDGRTYRILPIYANSADRTVDVRDFTCRGAKPAAGDYVLIFSDTDETCEFCKLDYDLWKQQGKALPLVDYELVWTAPDGEGGCTGCGEA